MTDTPLPFAPFQPSPPIVPEKPAKAKGRPKKPVEVAQPAATAPVEKPPRQKRRSAGPKPAKAAKKGHKFDLQTAMQLGASLSDLGEQTVFLKLVSDLSALPKGACKRIVGALAVVFA